MRVDESREKHFVVREDEVGIRVERSDPRDEAVTNEDCRGREAAVKEHPA